MMGFLSFHELWLALPDDELGTSLCKLGVRMGDWGLAMDSVMLLLALGFMAALTLRFMIDVKRLWFSLDRAVEGSGARVGSVLIVAMVAGLMLLVDKVVASN